MGILGGILLLMGVILFFLGLAPIAIFIGGIGVLFAVMAGGNGAAKGFGGGCLVIVAILGVGGYFLYNGLIGNGDESEDEEVSNAKTYPTKQDGDLFWEHLDDGGYRVYVKGKYVIETKGNWSDWNDAWLHLRKRRENGRWKYNVFVDYCSKVIPNSCNKGAFIIRNDSNWKDSRWTWQRCSCSTDNSALFFVDNSPNDNEDDVITLLNAMSGKRWFAAGFEDHHGRWIFARFNITGAFAKFIDLQEGVE